MHPAPDRPTTLREACVREALAIIAADGVERLSLREVARRLNVSHQAPYKHFASREHLLAAVVARAFDGFAAALQARDRQADPAADLAAMCRAYLGFAADRAAEFRLMFATHLPAHAEDAALAQARGRAFALLTEAIARLRVGDAAPDALLADAVFAWSVVHGLAGILQTGGLGKLPGTQAAAGAPITAHVLARMLAALRR
jgi:AcrR family transcriptional regulator